MQQVHCVKVVCWVHCPMQAKLLQPLRISTFTMILPAYFDFYSVSVMHGIEECAVEINVVVNERTSVYLGQNVHHVCAIRKDIVHDSFHYFVLIRM